VPANFLLNQVIDKKQVKRGKGAVDLSYYDYRIPSTIDESRFRAQLEDSDDMLQSLLFTQVGVMDGPRPCLHKHWDPCLLFLLKALHVLVALHVVPSVCAISSGLVLVAHGTRVLIVHWE
jgi:hypothetical protein